MHENTIETNEHPGIGRRLRRQMVAQWKEEGRPLGMSLKQWAAQQHPVGDAAYWWLQAKKNRKS